MDLKRQCKLIAELFDMSIFFVSSTGEVQFELMGNRILNPLYKNDKQFFFSVLGFDPSVCKEDPSIVRTMFFENYILIRIGNDLNDEGTIILGPSLPFSLSEHKINGLINDTHLFANREQVFHYYQSVPVIPHERLINITILVNQMFNHELIEAEDVVQDYLRGIHIKEKEIQGSINSSKGYDETLHHNPLNEKKLLTIVKEGKLDMLKHFTQLGHENTGVLSKSSHIRSKKNLGIIGIALAARAAIDGGLYSEIAFSVSDIYIQRLEDLRTDKEIDQCCLEAFFSLTEKVSQVKESQHSKIVTLCKNYIYNHRYSKITHEEIAEHAGISPNYLSVLFKKEVGIPVNEYIQQIKIEEAKHMIQFTSTPLSEIGSLLGFTDQSYFTKIFKKHTGRTPKQYQQTHHMIQE
ncbi:helix-turn-helix domain-containing protein [Paenibacillus pabuli]|uniref:helix-turn-helix domain-containing protein n=1 Tax=Paenibacillus pabuli TaxID=1472 RepID=UPI0020000BF2|nr:helix-turn-helix domain-containing protein [Paenibacillus pabuli]UPK41428.1 helix-turn-helix domain-containing protein [Paenibacillus pabuli]